MTQSAHTLPHRVRARLAGAAGGAGGAGGGRAEDVAANTRGEHAGEDGQPGVVVLAGERHQLVTTHHAGAEGGGFALVENLHVLPHSGTGVSQPPGEALRAGLHCAALLAVTPLLHRPDGLKYQTFLLNTSCELHLTPPVLFNISTCW